MKKYIPFILVLILAVFMLTACGGNEPAETDGTDIAESTAEETTKPVERDLAKGDYPEIGEGTVYVSTPAGTSEDGNVPVLYSEEDCIGCDIGLEAWDFNGAALSYIYVDGMLFDKAQLADTQTSIFLEGDALAVGTHTVEVVQYANDDTSSDMTAYRIMQYEVKSA